MSIRMTDASFVLMISNDFSACLGSVLGRFSWDNITIDGNHFTNCGQPVSIDQNDTPGNSRRRNNTFQRNVITGQKRAGCETGGGQQSFINLCILNNWFDALDFTPGDDGSCLCVSLVAQQATGILASRNFFRMGPINTGKYGIAVEITTGNARTT